ncbi:MAG: HypC/HybG/HupF family hydrogenase formation chaperone [Candidatus Omnitrophica bacterium]|nr:HypC/HybG/HupF family hydrogenase formation chaperone [Candidatus Omnitrophota bacterium]MDD5166382.1 HypC/HybG/HupF family hydrogenase formation chaperone [Candidatus Omnitrophota bacterium]
MCLAIPMKIKNIKGDFAEVEAGKLRRTINVQMLPQAKAGDYVLVHAGFAIQKVDPKKAKETLRLVDEVYR